MMKCGCTRRDFVRLTLGGLGLAAAPAAAAAGGTSTAKSVILLWMQGGPSQLETFDPKPGTEHGGPGKALATKTPGLFLGEALPRLAELSEKFSVVRTLNSRDPNHDTARYLLHTGNRTDPTVEHPHLGSLIAHELGTKAEGLPGCIAFGKDATTGSGYLPPELAPLLVEKIENPLEDLKMAAGVNAFRLADREQLLQAQNARFGATHPDGKVESHQKAVERAFSLLRSPHLKAFDVAQEAEEVRALYGTSPFGKACLMARRLVEAGVRFVEVALADWDTHADNFNRTKQLCGQLDPGMSGLLTDLDRRGLLQDTLVIWMGEFGRTPKLNAAGGRDHFTRAFGAALAGGGIAGGRVVGRTDALGMEAVDRPVSVPDLFATIYGRLGMDPRKKFMTPGGRPIKALEGGDPVKELLA